MSKITFDAGDNQLATLHYAVRHRRGLVSKISENMQAAVADDPDSFDAYDEWYLLALQDGVFRRVFVVEYREWSRHVEDLIRDQLSRNGLDSNAWDEMRAARGEGGYIGKVRRALDELLSARVSDTLWEDLEELRAVAETISQGTREARESLRGRYPDYFVEIDAFGDGDETARLTLTRAHAGKAFKTVEWFWDPEAGLPCSERSVRSSASG